MKILAYCNRSGVIGFTADKCPDGQLPIVRDEKEKVEQAIGGLCRYAYNNKTMLVPGIPEAVDDSAAMDALVEFTRRVRSSIPEA